MASVLITGASKGIGRVRAGAGGAGRSSPPASETLAGLPVTLRWPSAAHRPRASRPPSLGRGDRRTDLQRRRDHLRRRRGHPARELIRLSTSPPWALRVAQAVLPTASRGRRLLFLSSVVGRIVRPPGAAYNATKWALEARPGPRHRGRSFRHRTALLGPARSARVPRRRHHLHPGRRPLRRPPRGRPTAQDDPTGGRRRCRRRRRDRAASIQSLSTGRHRISTDPRPCSALTGSSACCAHRATPPSRPVLSPGSRGWSNGD